MSHGQELWYACNSVSCGCSTLSWTLGDGLTPLKSVLLMQNEVIYHLVVAEKEMDVLPEYRDEDGKMPCLAPELALGSARHEGPTLGTRKS